MAEAKGVVAAGDVLFAEVRAFYSEGLIINSLQTPMDADSVRCVKAELSLIASGKVKESLLHKLLVTAARQLMSQKPAASG